jgi:hypothetical protein
MTSLGSNPVWNNLSSKSTEVTGNSYSYVDNIVGPSQKGVGTDGTMSQVFTNTGAITDYIKYMISGPALGNQYFVNTGGVCAAPDGSTQPRHNYINNVANGADLVPQSMRSELSFLSDDLNGLIPGMLGDIEGLNPLYLFSSLSADSTPACACYSCPTTGGGSESYFLTPSLSPDFDPNVCQQVDVSQCSGQTGGTESFTNQGCSSTMVPTLLALGALILLQL